MNIQAHHNSKQQRFEVDLGAGLAYLSYTFRGKVVFFDHTFVPEAFRGKGVAAALVREGLEEARRRQWKVVPKCPYVKAFVERHAEFHDVVN